MGDQRLQPKTIKSNLTGLRSYQVDIGYADSDIEQFHHPMLQRIVNGIRRLRGDTPKRERRPITRDILLQLVHQFDQTTLTGATNHAAFCLAFAGFLRIGEFTWNNINTSDFGQWSPIRGSILIGGDKLELTLLSSKTDPFRKGVIIVIAAVSGEACAVASMRNLTRRFPAGLITPLFNPGFPYTRGHVTAVLRRALSSLGINGHYSGHSFRRGAATSARGAGLSDEEIQMLGRWKFDCYRLYIEAAPDYILNASRRLQR